MQKTFQRSMVLSLLLALGACGGEEAIPISPELGLNGPPTITVHPGTSQRFAFALQRNETATGQVTLSIEGLPPGVSASFDPATVSEGMLESTLELEATRNAERGTFLVTVRASGAESLVAERTFALEVRGITVEGRVRSIIPNAPPPLLQVAVGEQWVITDQTGRFTAHDVALPYDLVVVGSEIIEVFQGATTPTPQITGMMQEPEERFRMAELTGTVTPLPAEGEEIRVCVSVGEASFSPNCDVIASGDADGSFSLPVLLFNAESDEVQVVARRATLADGRLVAYTGLAEQSVTVSTTAPAEVSLTLGEATSTELVLQGLPAAGDPLVVTDLQGSTSFGAHLFFTGEIDPLLPVVQIPADGAASVFAATRSDTHQFGVLQLVTGPQDATLTFPEPLELVAPAAEDSLLPDTEFVTRGLQGGVATHLFQYHWGQFLAVHSAADRVTLPDLSRLGPQYGAESIGSWMVLHFPTVAGMEEALEGPFGYGALFSAIQVGYSAPLPTRTEAFAGLREPLLLNPDYAGPAGTPGSPPLLAQ